MSSVNAVYPIADRFANNDHTLITLGAHAQEGYCSWVCVSVKSHLTSGASVRPENTHVLSDMCSELSDK